jgi:hypothetical protein
MIQRPDHRYWMNIRDPMFDLPRYPPKIVVEIGSFKGAWAYRALKQWPTAHIFCVDPWEETNIGGSSANDDIFDYWIETNRENLGRRVWPLRMTSVDAGRIFETEIDFVFVDGLHTYEGLTLDLETWWTKLLPDGLLVVDNGYGIKYQCLRNAIDDFAKDRDIELHEGGASFKTAKRRHIRTDVWFWKDE